MSPTWWTMSCRQAEPPSVTQQLADGAALQSISAGKWQTGAPCLLAKGMLQPEAANPGLDARQAIWLSAIKLHTAGIGLTLRLPGRSM